MNLVERIYRADDTRISRFHTANGTLCANPIDVVYALLTTLARATFGHLIRRPWLVTSSVPGIAKRAENARIFEFGAGMSTLWFAERAAEVVSVESNEQWSIRLNAMLSKKHHLPVKLISDPEQYACYIHSLDGLFDIVLVDGINRKRCVEEGVKKLRTGGILIVDNSDVNADLVPRAVALGRFSVESFSGYAPGIFHANETSILTKLS